VKRLLAMLVLVALPAAAQEPPPPEEEKGEKDEPGTSVAYGPGGLVIASGDGNFKVQIRWRLQFRVSAPFDDDPETLEDFERPDRVSASIRRARLKVGGHAFRPWVDYFVEYDFPSSRLYDFRVTLERHPWMRFRLGQWKAEYNRERRDSSGEQQFAERSIVNAAFTIDRQQGVQLSGRVLPGTLLDSTYFAGVFTGMGSNVRANDDSHMMWVARYQWNLLGRELGFSQSDVEGVKKPEASLAVGLVDNRSPYTSFSSSGGGELPGYAPGVAGQYSVRQYLEEAALHYRGFSFQHEYHWKRIRDNLTLQETQLRGSYVQAGYLVYRPEPDKPKGLEVAARWAFVDPDTSRPQDRQEELTGALNWFFRGHANKLTLDVSRLSLEQRTPEGEARPDLRSTRARLQWDVHF
jgi:hypothetical protein